MEICPKVIYSTPMKVPALILGLCRALRNKVDERGNSVEAYCVRPDGELSKTGFAISRNKFDDDGQMISQSILTVMGTLF